MTSTFPATEDALQKQVVRHLSAVLPSDCFLHHSPNEGVRKVAFKMKLKSMGTQFGWPDLEIFAPDTATHNGLPQCLFIELKLAKGSSQKNKFQYEISCSAQASPGSSADPLRMLRLSWQNT